MPTNPSPSLPLQKRSLFSMPNGKRLRTPIACVYSCQRPETAFFALLFAVRFVPLPCLALPLLLPSLPTLLLVHSSSAFEKASSHRDPHTAPLVFTYSVIQYNWLSPFFPPPRHSINFSSSSLIFFLPILSSPFHSSLQIIFFYGCGEQKRLRIDRTCTCPCPSSASSNEFHQIASVHHFRIWDC